MKLQEAKDYISKATTHKEELARKIQVAEFTQPKGLVKSYRQKLEKLILKSTHAGNSTKYT